MKIVTAGLKFLDVDAYAGCIAYAELLNLQGIEAIAYSTAMMNESITQTIRSWGAPMVDDYVAMPDDVYILIDVSEPNFIEKNADLDRVEEVIDHHVGFEEFWAKRIGQKADIEFIGAACTQVYERWKQLGLVGSMSKTSARLLVAGILDNTLNFKATVTTPRDEQAYEELLKIAALPEDWAATYFEECGAAIFVDISGAISGDTKVMSFKNLGSDLIAAGQLVVWDGSEVVESYHAVVSNTMQNISDQWFANIVSISENKSYFISDSVLVKEWIERVIGVQFQGTVAQADRLWLRKEIVKEDLQYGQDL